MQLTVEQAIAAEKQKLEAQYQEVITQAKNFVKGPEELHEKEMELMSLEARYNSVDWEEFGKNDPGRAALTAQQYQVAHEKLKQEIAEKRTEHEKTVQKRQGEYFQAAQQEFIRRVPEWKDKKIADAEGDQMTKLVTDYGIKAQEIGQITDPRMRHMIRDFAILKAEKDSADASSKKVVSKGKTVLRRSAVTGRFMKKGNKSAEIVDRARKTGDKRDVHAAAKSILHEAGIV